MNQRVKERILILSIKDKGIYMKKKRIISLLLSFIFLLSTVGCGDEVVVNEQKEKVEITLSWWGNDTRNEYTLEAVRMFEEEHPDIKVKCSYTEWSGYEARNQVRMVSGNETDVMQINVGWLMQYSADGTGYYDLEKLSDTVDLSNFDEDTLEYGRMNGVLNAIPIAMNAETIYINKTLYDKYGLDIPATWDDFFNAAKVMKKDDVYPLSGASKSIWLFCIAYAEQTNKKTMFDEDGKLNFDKNDFQTMIEFYDRLLDEKVIPKVEDYQRYNINNHLYAGTVAWVSDAFNYYSTVIEEGDEIIPANYIAYSPEDAGIGWYEKPATLYAISKNTEHPKEAAMLLDYMLNSETWAKLQGVEKGIPVSSSARKFLDDDGQLEGLQYDASLVMENNDKISAMNSLVEDSGMYEEFINACNEVHFEKGEPEDVAADLVKLYKDLGFYK